MCLEQIDQTVSVTSDYGHEIHITYRSYETERFVTICVDDGVTITTIDLPRVAFDTLVRELRTVH